MRPLYRKAVKDVTARKLRALLTILGIAVGVAGLTAINITQGQIKSAIQYAQDASATPDITYYTSPVDSRLASELARRPNVKVVQAAGSVSTRWQVPTGHKSLQIVGFPNLQRVNLMKFELSSGRLPSPGEILMESSNSGLAPVHVGDRITVQARGEPKTLIVSGLVRTRGRMSSALTGAGLAYMRLPDLNRTFVLSGANYFLVAVDQVGERKVTAKALLPIFAAHHVTVLGGAVTQQDGASTIVDGIFAVMRVLSIVALLLSIFLLLSTITTLVTEQVRVIGTMKAIGGTRAAIMRTYLLLVGIFGVIGTVVGFLLGLLAAFMLIGLMSSILTLDTGTLGLGVGTILVALLVGIGVPLLAAVLPVYLGTRITVHQALSGYGLAGAGLEGRAGHTGWARAVARVLAAAPRTVQLGIRSVFRRRTRAFLTLLALSVSGAAFLSVQTTSYSFSSAISHVFDTYNFQVMAELTNPAPYARVDRVVERVPGVKATERFSQIGVETKWGVGLLTGVEPYAKLYRKHMVSGRWFTPRDRNVLVLSKTAADRAGLKVGDSVPFHTDLHAASWRVIGVAVDSNGLGLTFGVMLAPIAEANRFQGLPADYASAVLIDSTSSDQGAINALNMRIDSALSTAGFSAQVQTAKEFKDAAVRMVSIINVLLYAVVVVVALVGAIGLFNTLAMSVLERRREIGILRSMGATGRKVAGVFWTEAVSLGVVAWLMGIVIGIPAAFGFVKLLGALLMDVPFAFNPMSPVLMLLFTLAVATLASVLPVWGAARMRVAQTLRYEG